MTVREGSLEAPTRHPLAWKSSDFWSEEELNKELERVFNVCHGCRRCVSLCGSFPTLFDLVDNGPTGEVDGVPKEKYKAVVDQCYLCDMCYMTKCPYVPPHPWNLDFPHLMLRAKAVHFRAHGATASDKFLTSTDKVGMFAGIPIVTQVVNTVNRTAAGRGVMEKIAGIDRTAWLPDFAGTKFRSSARSNTSAPVVDGAKTPGKVAIFSTCYVNYNEPGIGHDLIKILEHNAIPYVLAEKEACCGMPKLEIGDLDSVEKLKNINIPQLARLAREGYAIVTAIPSCTLMYKQELPLMFPDDEDVQLVKEAMWDPFEYLMARNKDGLLKTRFQAAARHRLVPRALPRAGAEHRPQDRRSAETAARHQGAYGGALLGPLGHLGHAQGIPRHGDEDRQAGVQEHGERAAGLREFGLPAGRPSHRTGDPGDGEGGDGRQDAAGGSPDHPGPHCIRSVIKRIPENDHGTDLA